MNAHAYPRYARYKDSGVEWLGEIPEGWDVQRLKHLCRCNPEALPEDTDPEWCLRYVDIGNVDAVNGIIRTEDHTFANSPSRARRIVRDGDVIVSTVRTYLKAIATINGPPDNLIVSTGFAVLRPIPELDSRFMGYALHAPHFLESVVAHSVGVGYPAINASVLTGFRVVLPSLPEQRAIASFLDRKTAKIDALIEKQERLIERLEEKRKALISRAVTRGLNPDVRMKDSGVEWLGRIPEHWATPPLYARYTVQLGKMLDAKSITGEHAVPYLRNTDVQWDRINTADLKEMDIAPEEWERYTLQPGDLLVCEGGDVGRAATWRGDLTTCGYQKALHRMRPLRADEHVRYMYYTLFTVAHLGVFVSNGNPNTIAHLTGEKLRVYRFPKPPVHEQAVIAKALDVENERVNRMVARVQQLIEKLREKRTVLIAAAVTGKIDVREAA